MSTNAADYDNYLCLSTVLIRRDTKVSQKRRVLYNLRASPISAQSTARSYPQAAPKSPSEPGGLGGQY